MKTPILGIGLVRIPATATLMTSSYSDFEQGWNEIALGLKGDSLTPTTNSMSELLYDGNDAVYHFSTNAASAIATTGLSLVKTSNPAVTGEANNIAERAAMHADDVIKSGKYSILSYEDAENIAFDAIHGPNNADAVVLGKYGDGGSTAYTSVAKDMDAQYFQLDNWDELAARYSDDEIWKINEKFLDI